MRKLVCKMLGWATFVLVYTLVLLYGNTAKAEVRIKNDCGGLIGTYLQRIKTINAMQETVVVDGKCVSACTLYLGLVPKNRVCATPRARFGFHQAWMPDESGRPIKSEEGTEFLWSVYSKRVQALINKKGGLTKKMIYLEGAALSGIIKQCHFAPQGALVAQASMRPPPFIFNAPPCR